MVVELALVEEDVGVVSAVTLRLRWPTNSPIRAQGVPRKCSRLIRRWRRSCGDQSGIAAARQALAIEVRKASAPESGKSRASGVAVVAWAELGFERLGDQRVELDPERLPRLRRRGAKPDSATSLVVVTDEGAVDRRDARPPTNRGTAAAARASAG